MEKVLPCRKCGSAPYFKPYEQSNDGNHDIPASVTCPTCGRSTVMDWNLWFEVVEEVGDEKYAKPTAYLSARFMDALGDATIRKWNRENGGRAMTEVVFDMNADTGDVCVKERVVRCRACRHFSAYESWDGGWCSEWEGETEPDGFCYLGKES